VDDTSFVDGSHLFARYGMTDVVIFDGFRPTYEYEHVCYAMHPQSYDLWLSHVRVKAAPLYGIR
jgi:hypothetical protein